MFDLELMRRLSGVAALSDAEIDELRAHREEPTDTESRHEALEGATSPAQQMSDAEVAGLISAEARDLVISFEVGSRQLYEKKYITPIWPKGDSGITIGIGYDIGYHIVDEVRSHWGGLISDADIERLVPGVGLKRKDAAAACGQFKDIRVPWDAAIAAYERSTMPKYGRLVLGAFPRALDLHPHSFGALFSLVFNRGARMTDRSPGPAAQAPGGATGIPSMFSHGLTTAIKTPGDRQEMRNIRDQMAAGTFDGVPSEIRSMRRLWVGKGLPGLLKRRASEAVLFERGLELQRVAAVVAPDLRTESLEGLGDDSRFDGDGLYYEEDTEDAPVRESALWNDVKWPANDDTSPDYTHIADRSLSGKTFEIDARALELLIRVNDFEPIRDHGRIVFALRGAELVTSLTAPQVMQRQQDRPALTLRDCRPNHKDFRCVIGVYDLTTGRLSGFAASTVPNRKAVAGYYTSKVAGNMTPTGCYRFQVGWHMISKPARKVPGCLVEAGRQKCVHRSTNNLSYDVEDTWENHKLHGNNLHPAFMDSSAAFSSWGCLVINGTYKCTSPDREKGTHVGEWALFRQALGLSKLGAGDHGREYDVVLLTGLEAAIASSLVQSGADANQDTVRARLGRLRQGSRGLRVCKLQRSLGLPETGVFSHDVVKVWTDRQRSMWANKSMGVYSPDVDTQLAFGVFAPDATSQEPVVVASGPVAVGGGWVESTGAAAQKSRLEALYYEIGLETEAHRRNPALGSSSLESVGTPTLEAVNLEFGFSALKSMGTDVVQTLERLLQQKICLDPVGHFLDRDNLRDKVNSAAQDGLDGLRRYLSLLLGRLTFLPSGITDKVVEVLFTRLLAPLAGETGDVVLSKVDLSAQWLCQRWAGQGGGGGEMPSEGKNGHPSPSPEVPPPSPGDREPSVDKLVHGPVTSPTHSPSPGSKRVAELLDLIERTAHGAQPDGPGVRHYIEQLRNEYEKGALQVSPADIPRLLKAICESTTIDNLPAVIGADPYALMRGIEAALKKSAPDRAQASEIIEELHALLGDARIKVQPEEVKRLLKVVRGAKMFDELSWISDRLVSRDQALFGTVANAYAQGLIDSGYLVAGLGILASAEAEDALTGPDAIDASGIVGRGNKQIYVNHIKTPSDAAALRESFGGFLTRAAENYGRYVDVSRPGDNWYLGINYVAMLKRAERDRIDVRRKGDPDAIARGIIAALEPQVAAGTKDFWMVATVAEAYVALGDYDRAAEYYARYAQIEETDAFALAGSIRQLEEVWQIPASTHGPGAIVTNLKAALLREETGAITLSAPERREILKSSSLEYQSVFETTTADGKYINFALLKQIVMAGGAVAMIQAKVGQSGRTVGTGFLLHGPDLFGGLAGDKSYILTNAHVLYDPIRGPGFEQSGIAPDDARIVFENDQIDGRPEVYTCSRIVWQSPSSFLDATLIELDRRVTHIKPVTIAPQTTTLTVAGDGKEGSKLAVLGHPRGGNLAVGVLGSLEEMHGTLVDKGPRTSTEKPIFLHYMTPTEPGNSGSPVFEASNWSVVALHHAGFVEGSRGLQKLGGKQGNNLANEGIWIESIKSALRQELQPPAQPPKRRRLFGG